MREADTFTQGQYVPDNVGVVQKTMEENTVLLSMFPDKPAASSLIQPVIDQIMDEERQLDANEGLSDVADRIREEFEIE
ncbi:hypothetical protein [Bacillus sp. JCM 19041]|uniref:hypothetical protein n=1 Tax=Bacillus sp. JCM 19041 TaxID=1460637 RepID=UPI0006D0B165